LLPGFAVEYTGVSSLFAGTSFDQGLTNTETAWPLSSTNHWLGGFGIPLVCPLRCSCWLIEIELRPFAVEYTVLGSSFAGRVSTGLTNDRESLHAGVTNYWLLDGILLKCSVFRYLCRLIEELRRFCCRIHLGRVLPARVSTRSLRTTEMASGTLSSTNYLASRTVS
jgi:hypothetical protein